MDKRVKADPTEWPRLLFHIFSGMAIVVVYGLTSISKPSVILILGMIAFFCRRGPFSPIP